jgi:hypothetical protein
MKDIDPRTTTCPEEWREDLVALTLFERICWAKEHLERVEPQYRIVFEPNDEEPAQITIPAPEWLAMAMFGYLLPPVWVYHEIEANLTPKGSVTNGHLLHETPPLPPMTEEEAMEYLLQRCPREVWDPPHGTNRQRFVICRAEQIPTTRTYRDAWRLAA